MAALLPTNRPAPMIPPIEIIATWRDRSERLKLSVSRIADLHRCFFGGVPSRQRTGLTWANFPDHPESNREIVEIARKNQNASRIQGSSQVWKRLTIKLTC